MDRTQALVSRIDRVRPKSGFSWAIALIAGLMTLGSTSSAFALQLAQATPTEPSEPGDESSVLNPSESPQDSTRFVCQLQNGNYEVMYLPESQPGAMYPWASPGDMGGGWSADRRCVEISRRLEAYRPDGLLELRTSVENGYNIVCAITERDPACRIVFTVPNGQDPLETRDRVFDNLAIANSGQDTTAVNTFTSGDGYQVLERIGREIGIDLPSSLPSLPTRRVSSRRSTSIDLRPFLDPADGGTGERLR